MDPSAPKESSAPMVLGILSIIFGSLILLSSVVSSCAAAGDRVGGCAYRMNNRGSSLLKEKKEGALRLIKVVETSQHIFMGVMSALLLALGIGQVRQRRWALAWTMRWSGFALWSLLALGAVSLLVLLPAYRNVPGSFTSATSFYVHVALNIAVYAPWPVLQLYFFSRQKVRDVMWG